MDYHFQSLGIVLRTFETRSRCREHIASTSYYWHPNRQVDIVVERKLAAKAAAVPIAETWRGPRLHHDLSTSGMQC